VGYFNEGAIAESAQRLDDALKLYSTALELQPEASEPLEALTRVLIKLKREPEAFARLDATTAQFPKVPIALNIKGEILLKTQHPADAEIAFKSAIERQPKWWVPYRGLATAQAANHELDAAIATLRDAIAKVDQPQALQTPMALLFESAGKPEEAIRIYEDELRKSPDSDVAANNLAMLLIRRVSIARSRWRLVLRVPATRIFSTPTAGCSTSTANPQPLSRRCRRPYPRRRTRRHRCITWVWRRHRRDRPMRPAIACGAR
jgi:tetratricopeptide (TPR) repeat protein